MLLLIGRFVSTLGTYFQSFALSLYVLRMTGDPALFAATVSIRYIPQLLLGPFAGVIADRFDRKKIVVGLDLLSGVIIALFAILHITQGTFTMNQIYIMQVALGIISVFFSPASMTLLPNVVPEEDRPAANSADSMLGSIAELTSPILGALLLGFGIVPIMIINSMSFILSAISEMFIYIPKVIDQNKQVKIPDFWGDFKEGLVFMLKNRMVLAFTLTAIVSNLAIAPFFSVTSPYIIKETLGASDFVYGVTVSVTSIGMLIGPMIAPILFKKFSPRQISIIGYLSISLVILSGVIFFQDNILRNVKNTNFHIAVITGIGLVCTIILIVRGIEVRTSFQKEVPNALYGRVGSVVNTVGLSSVPLGQMLIGFVLGTVSPSMIFLATGGTVFVAGLLYAALTAGNSNKMLKQASPTKTSL